MRSIDDFPTNRIGNVEYRIGRIFPFGATTHNGKVVNFSVFTKEASSCTLLLYHKGEKKPYLKIPFPEEFRVGNVYSMRVYGLDIDDLEYGYLMDGEYDREKGLMFNKDIPLLDPYSHSVSGRVKWGQKPDPKETFVHRGRVIMEDYDWRGDTPLRIPQKDLVIYEMHVRSFTADESSGVKHRGMFAGLIEKIPYLKELGVNCVELLPVFEFDEFENSRVVNGRRLYNYWGYSTVNFFSPKAGYASSGPLGMEADEVKNMIRTLHENGIEVILDVVFNHTAEGNENGPTISYRGIDNRTYYLLTPDGWYYNFSGCGNTMNCNNAVVRNHILDCLRYWVASYHVDGFRFDLASILTRDPSGAPMISPPLLETIAHDAVLGSCKLIAEAWDAGGLYQVGSFPSWNRWSEWNGKYRDCVRRFVKGEGECAPELYIRIEGSPDMYFGRDTSASINFITCHDGFTLYDLVSYNEKHNEANGENNNDGSNDNNSWNCGTEGETDNKEIKSLRLRQMENMMTILLTSRGVPMIYSGDEFANTQFGNNNAYCQDNEISWLDWSFLEKNKELFTFVQDLIALRNAHPVLRSGTFDNGENGTHYPELSFHGCIPWELDRNAPGLVFAYMFAEDHKKYRTKSDCFIYVMVNAHWEEHCFTLPIIPKGYSWHMVSQSGVQSFAPGKEKKLDDVTELILGGRSTVILLGREAKGKKCYR